MVYTHHDLRQLPLKDSTTLVLKKIPVNKTESSKNHIRKFLFLVPSIFALLNLLLILLLNFPCKNSMSKVSRIWMMKFIESFHFFLSQMCYITVTVYFFGDILEFENTRSGFVQKNCLSDYLTAQATWFLQVDDVCKLLIYIF